MIMAPAGFKLGPNSRAWTEESIEQWIATRAAADSSEAA